MEKEVELKFEKLGGKKFKSLTNEDMLKISGGRKTYTRTSYTLGKVVDCSEDYPDCTCNERLTHTLTYEENIFGKRTVISNTTTSDGTAVSAC
jgi:hypothetical protein